MVEQPEDTRTERLADVIGRVREELEHAQRQGADSGLKFRVDKVSLEFAVQVRREGNGKGALRVGVVSFEAGGSVARDATHRLTVELVPNQGPDQDGGYSVTLIGGD